MSRSAIRALFAFLLILIPPMQIGCDTPSTPSGVTPGPSPAANYPTGKTAAPSK